MSGAKLYPKRPDKPCPNCGRSAKAFSHQHCDSPTCPWVTCPCGERFQIDGSGHFNKKQEKTI